MTFSALRNCACSDVDWPDASAAMILSCLATFLLAGANLRSAMAFALLRHRGKLQTSVPSVAKAAPVSPTPHSTMARFIPAPNWDRIVIKDRASTNATASAY